MAMFMFIAGLCSVVVWVKPPPAQTVPEAIFWAAYLVALTLVGVGFDIRSTGSPLTVPPRQPTARKDGQWRR